MQQTETYQFNLIENSDSFSPQPINENTQAIEEALSEAAQAINAVSASCTKLAVGSYTGSNTFGSGSPNKLTFGFEPKVVLVLRSTSALSDAYQSNVVLIRPLSTGVTGSDSASRITVTWGSNSVSWYSTASSYQLNTNGWTYYYFALG